jgi:hypothetical protein
MGAVCNIWGPYGIRVCQVGAVCAILEVDGTISEVNCTIWEPHVPYNGHMGVWCAIWDPCVPYGSRMCHKGATCTIWGATCTIWGATCTIWEPHAPYAGHMGAIRGSYEGHVCTMGGRCPRWELRADHVSYMLSMVISAVDNVSSTSHGD